MSREFKTPYFIMDREKLEKNLIRLKEIEKQSGVKILHSLKSFNEYSVLPRIVSVLSGVSSSSLSELEMAKKLNSKKTHLYRPAYKEEEMKVFLKSADTLSFNSLAQWDKFHLQSSNASLGLRVNPKLNLPIPNYCNPNLDSSRLGIDYREFLEAYQGNRDRFSNLEGLHFHALFQSSPQGTEILLDHITNYYGMLLKELKWLNLGGGHNFTDESYDIELFVKIVDRFKSLYPQIELYFEPGESVVKECGHFVTTVLDILTIGEKEVVILDTSIETHLLDVAIVHQRLKVKGTQSASTPYLYELTGNSSLQGDIIGDYFFLEKLNVGDEVIFEDMMSYTMVKMTEFNGIKRANFLYG